MNGKREANENIVVAKGMRCCKFPRWSAKLCVFTAATATDALHKTFAGGSWRPPPAQSGEQKKAPASVFGTSPNRRVPSGFRARERAPKAVKRKGTTPGRHPVLKGKRRGSCPPKWPSGRGEATFFENRASDGLT